MRAVIQRVLSAQVECEGEIVGIIQSGLCVLVAIAKTDSHDVAEKMAQKLVKLRIFNDADGKMNLAINSLLESETSRLLVISNFTVYGDANGQHRPSFMASAGAEQAKPIFDHLLATLDLLGYPTQTGVFGGDMKVSLVNDGPVTLVLEV
jgi:D-aminoacyl-tRNA deacylase